jgi:hypothetical protein
MLLVLLSNGQHSQSQKSHYNWRTVSRSVLVLSPIWGSWPDIYFCESYCPVHMRQRLGLLLWATHIFLPPFIPVSVVIATSRLQFTTTDECPDTFYQIVCVCVCVCVSVYIYIYTQYSSLQPHRSLFTHHLIYVLINSVTRFSHTGSLSGMSRII